LLLISWPLAIYKQKRIIISKKGPHIYYAGEVRVRSVTGVLASNTFYIGAAKNLVDGSERFICTWLAVW